MLVNAKLIYITLRCICIMYLTPIGYLAVLFTYREWFQGQTQIWKLVFARSKQLTGRLQIIAAGWFIAALVVLLIIVFNHLYWKWKLADNIPEDDDLKLRIYHKACRDLKVREDKLPLYRNPLVKGPFIIGLIHPQIILPERDYTEEDLEIIFYHELSHHKHGDLKFKVMALVVIVFNFYNLGAYLLFLFIDLWSERMADVSAVENSDKILSANMYFDNIVNLIPEKDKKEIDGPLISTLGENKKAVSRRVEFMGKYQKMKSAGKLVTALFTAVFVVGSASTAYASGKTIADLHSIVYQNTEVRTNETPMPTVGSSVVAEDGLIEYHCRVEDLDMDNIQIISEPTDEIAPHVVGQYYYFDWNVNPNTRHVSGEYSVLSGMTMHTSATVTPSNKEYWLGIMDDDGAAWYVVATGSTGHDFKIRTTNKYRVFVQNNYTDSTVLHAVGNYMYDYQ